MDINTLQTIWTVLAFIAFIGIVLWAFSSKRRNKFDEAARLPFSQQDKAIHDKTNGEQKHV